MFLRYGTGISQYFSIQAKLIQLFCILTLFAVPQMIIYDYFDGYNWTSNVKLFEKLSFGDMGYSGNFCGKNFINWRKETTTVGLQC